MAEFGERAKVIRAAKAHVWEEAAVCAPPLEDRVVGCGEVWFGWFFLCSSSLT